MSLRSDLNWNDKDQLRLYPDIDISTSISGSPSSSVTCVYKSKGNNGVFSLKLLPPLKK